MLKAVSYTRISDKDQSTFSIPGQADIIATYCNKNNIELIASFVDEGESAKNFDRTDWKELASFIKKNHNGVDMLLVAKFDRFSRNVSEALQMIDLLEKRFSIRVISAMEPIHLHPDSPYYFQFRSQILLGADIELRIIRDRTKFGMQQAAKSGRFVTKAPYGYLNVRDENNKPVIIVDPVKAPAVATAFERFLDGETIDAIRKDLKVKGRSALQVMLQHPAYMGYVRKSAYYDEPESFIKGIHEPIVSEDIWWKVQAIFKQKKKIHRTTISEDFPLRGVLKCFCGRCFTGAMSKGKKMYVGYYKCNGHTNKNYNAKKLHAEFDEILKNLSLQDIHIRYLQQKVMENIKEQLAINIKEQETLQKYYADLLKKIDNLEEKYFNNDIDKETFSKWKMRYHSEKNLIDQQLRDLAEPVDEVWRRYEAGSDQLADLHRLYNDGTAEEKQSFVRLMFNNSLYYHEGLYRTPYILDLFKHKALILNEKRLLDYQQPPVENGIIAGSAPYGTRVEPLYQLLSLLNDIKTA